MRVTTPSTPATISATLGPFLRRDRSWPPWYIGMCEPRIVQAPRARFVKARAIEIIWSCIKLLFITRSSQVITAHRQVRCSTP